MKRGRLAVALALTGVAASGCSVGSGAGSADGYLFEVGCSNLTSKPVPGGLVRYSLRPAYFAGVPIEGLSMTNPIQTNQLSIRMQDNGLAIQYADVMNFDILTSYEVARCLRGRTVNGEPDWNVTEPLPDGTRTWWCDWGGTVVTDGGAIDASVIPPTIPDGGVALDGGMSVMATYPRIHVTPYTDVRASLATLSTCGITNIIGRADDGWISFQYFGSAEEPELAPGDRHQVPGDFVIQFGDRMRASFYVTLTDAAIIAAREENMSPPVQQIGGWLQGYFDFDLERGRSAQPFP